MYSNIINIEIERRRIFVEYTNGSKVEFISDEDMVFKKNKVAHYTGTANGIVGNCEVDKFNNLIITAMPSVLASFFFPNEFIWNVNKYIKKHGLFSLNYCKHLRNTFSRLQFSEVCLNKDEELPESAMVKVEKLRNLASKYSTGVYSKTVLLYYFRNNNILYAIMKGGVIVEKNTINGISLPGVPMYEP